ncbi:MAG: hypothetical protein E6G89_02975, partial [Alphaproteobacteria bacterium]
MALGRFSLRKPGQQPVPMAPAAPLLSGKPKAGQSDVNVADAESQTQKRRLLTAKLRIHRRLIDEINLAAMDKMPEKEVRVQI